MIQHREEEPDLYIEVLAMAYAQPSDDKRAEILQPKRFVKDDDGDE